MEEHLQTQVGREEALNVAKVVVEDSTFFYGVQVGLRAKIRRTIFDNAIRIPPGFTVGYNLEEDAKRFTVSDSGVVVIPRGVQIEEGS